MNIELDLKNVTYKEVCDIVQLLNNSRFKDYSVIIESLKGNSFKVTLKEV